MRWQRSLLIVVVVCVTLVVCLSAFATTRSEVVSFDLLGAPGRGTSGLVVSSQFAGVTFANASAFDYSKGGSAIANFAHSANVAVEPCVGVEFCTAPLAAGFGAAQASVKVWVGFSYPLAQPLGVRLTAFNDSTVVGMAEATLPANPSPTAVRTPLEVRQAAAVITRFEVSVTTGGGYTGGLAVDDVEFSAATPPPPCAASGPPTVTLSQPRDGSPVARDVFSLAGSVEANGAPITAAFVTVHSAAGDKVAEAFPSLVSAGGGFFGPASFSGLLAFGDNEVTVSATNCAGTGSSAPGKVTLLAPPPPCAASGPPTVTLSEPAAGSSVYTDEFSLAGSVEANGAPITAASVTVHSAAGDKVTQVFASVVSAGGGSFGPTSLSGLLTLGDNEVTASATNCAGTGTSAPRTVTLLSPPLVEACRGLPEPSQIYVAEDEARLRAKLDNGFRGRVIFPLGLSWRVGVGGHDVEPIQLQPGVQLVGERDALGRRPLIQVDGYTPEPAALFQIEGPGVCIEGLHLKGPSSGKGKQPERTDGVHVFENPGVYHSTTADVVIADNELDGWTGAAVEVIGPADPRDHRTMKPADAGRVRVERNYIHHNAMDSLGYGVAVSYSAYVTVARNVFDFNRHDVTSAGQPHSGYVARYNYMLEGAFSYGGGYYAPHLDVHGTGKGHYGGGAGEYHLIEWNTIRGEQPYGKQVRNALVLRGRASKGVFARHNVLVHDNAKEAFRVRGDGDPSLEGKPSGSFGLSESYNKFDIDHSSELVAGDFDGDGYADLLLTDGTGWLLSRRGVRPWEFLRPSQTLRDQLAFADIDNDGATDVLFRNDRGDLGYYPRGTSATITPLTTSPVPARDLRFGDFDGDQKTDIFYTLNGQWRIWYGQTHKWANAQTSRVPLANLLVGEFDDAKGTDVATVSGSDWSYSSGATKPWTRLNKRLRSSFSNAVAADFDGNGRTDIAFDDAGTWHYSPDGRRPLQLLRPKNGAVGPLHSLLIGRFEAGRKAMVVAFDPSKRNYFAIWRGLDAKAPFVLLSEQPMR